MADLEGDRRRHDSIGYNYIGYMNLTMMMMNVTVLCFLVPFLPICSQHCLLLFCVFSLIFVFCVCTFLFVVIMFPFGRLLVLYFSLVVPAICNFLLHICICFPSKINDDDDDETCTKIMQ